MDKRLIGKPVADKILDWVKLTIEDKKLKPKLAVVITKDDPASLLYVNKKQEVCSRVGIASQLYDFRSKSEQQLHELVKNIEADGVLVQLPLREGFSKYALFDSLNPEQDVDCFTPKNVGLVNQNRAHLWPCTPKGILEVARYYGIKWLSKRVVVINRSDVVGKSLSMMLTHEDATVTLCHDQTPPELLKELCLQSDIVIVAVGIPGFITPDMVTNKTIIFDVGITRCDKIYGDVAPATLDVVRAYTPVPGGIGPCTVACLARNVVWAYLINH